MAAHDSLGNDGFLSKIDRLRATNVGSMIPLPQVIVVGDQSSGKSSALESLTGFAFPRAATLCTRYATQISCTRGPEKMISVSIIPRPDASGELKERLQAFHRNISELDADKLADIFNEANTAMGIRMQNDLFNTGGSAFSEDILSIKIQGPEETHLTLIDVPGIFRIPTPGLTTESDILLVRNMVKRYMENSRTIILTVISCNVDIASQEILKLAADADPEGVRTMGVLTKPDLLQEAATRKPVLELVEGHRNPLKLGYCVIANRGADDTDSSEEDRVAAEHALFQSPPWSNCSNTSYFGTDSLRERLRTLLMDISQRELSGVRAEIVAKRRVCAEKLLALGNPRDNDHSQRQYLVHLAAQMQSVTRDALCGYYSGQGGLFEKREDLRLITKIVKLNESFSDMFWKRGHLQHFRDKWSSDGEFPLSMQENKPEQYPGDSACGCDDNECTCDGVDMTSEHDSIKPSELDAIVVEGYKCPKPKPGPMNDLIQEMFLAGRGPELGTFNGTILSLVFRKVSSKWEALALDHTSKAIITVHEYIYQALTELCPDAHVKGQLWDMVLRDELCKRYQKAMDYTRSLLQIERSGLPITLNHYFNSTVQKTRENRYRDKITKHSDGEYVSLEFLTSLSTNMGNSEHVCNDILDTVESYYKVSRKRFVDTLCQHVVYYMLLVGPDSPLSVLSPESILQVSQAQLEAIAGEDAVTRSQRGILRRQVESLDEAIKVLRS